MEWKYDTPHFSAQDLRAKKLVNDVFGASAGDGLARGLSLYRYLNEHKNVETEVLRASVKNNNEPLFEAKDFKEIMDVVKSASQKGGGLATPRDPEADEFWDQMIRKLVSPLSSSKLLSCVPQERIDNIFYFVFLLNNLEQIDFLGPMLSTALDSVTLSLPVLADLTQEMAGKVIGLFPVPYAALVGEAIGYAIALIFVLTGMTLNVSRRRFGSAFKTSLAAIPIVGDILMMGATSFEKGAERYMINRQKFIDALKKYSPHGADVADYWSPTPEIVTRPAVYPDPELLKRNIIRTGSDFLGIKGVDPNAILKDPRGPAAALAAAALDKGTGVLNAATARATTAATGALNAATARATTAATGALNAATARATTAATGALNAARATGAATAAAARKKTRRNPKRR
jgi:hypothetical protein